MPLAGTIAALIAITAQLQYAWRNDKPPSPTTSLSAVISTWERRLKEAEKKGSPFRLTVDSYSKGQAPSKAIDKTEEECYKLCHRCQLALNYLRELDYVDYDQCSYNLQYIRNQLVISKRLLSVMKKGKKRKKKRK